MTDGSRIENRFWLYLSSIFSNLRKIWIKEVESHADNCHMTKIAIYGNSGGLTAAIFKMMVSLYPNRESLYT